MHSFVEVTTQLLGVPGVTYQLSERFNKDPVEALHKAAFKDSLSLRYGWPLHNCICGQPFSVEHALTCKTGGFPAVRHNEVRDITAMHATDRSVPWSDN